jgi:predicted RNA methylase
MTPPHIAGLMAKLANPQPDSVILDIACGTGNLLAACAQGQLVGIEQEPALLSMCRQKLPATAHLYVGNCFAYTDEIRQHQPTIGLMNPPYSKQGQETQAFAFLDYLLTCLQPGARAIAVLPLTCGISASDTKVRLMRQHTLHAVMTLPKNLFSPEAHVETLLMVWEAHRPHSVDHPTWFADWSEDGFVVCDGTRVDAQHQWAEREQSWLTMYRAQRVLPDVSLLQGVGPADEWCFAAHTPTDYHCLAPDLFLTALVNNLAFSAAYDPQALRGVTLTNDLPLTQGTWRPFLLTDWFTLRRGHGTTRLRDFRAHATGTIPVISATTQQNGVRVSTDTPAAFPAHRLTIAVCGQGAGCAFYHQYPFNAIEHVCILTPTFAMTPLVGLFLTVVLNQASQTYSFSRRRSVARLGRMTIALPVDATGQPDWRFMDTYMRCLRVARAN